MDVSYGYESIGLVFTVQPIPGTDVAPFATHRGNLVRFLRRRPHRFRLTGPPAYAVALCCG